MAVYLGDKLISGVFTAFNTTTFDTSDANATAADLLLGKTAYVNGSKITGNIPTVPIATPTISVNTNGLITATLTQQSGYISTVGTTTKTLQLSSSQDADFIAANIKTGVNIFGITGTFTSDATATAAQIQNGKTAYVNGNKITGTLAPSASTILRGTTIAGVAGSLASVTWGSALPSSATNGDSYFLASGSQMTAGSKTIAGSTSSYSESVPSGSTTLSYTQTTGFNTATINFTSSGFSYSIPWVRSVSDNCIWNLAYSVTWTPPGGSATTVASSTLSSISTSGTISSSVTPSLSSAIGTATVKITLTFTNTTLGTTHTYTGSTTQTVGGVYTRYLRSGGAWTKQ